VTGPDAPTLLKFRHLPETNILTERIFTTLNSLLAATGLLLKVSAVVNATFIDAPSSPRNNNWARDPEVHQTKRGSQCDFGMRVHISFDAVSELPHTLNSTVADVSDITQARMRCCTAMSRQRSVMRAI